MSYKVGMAAKSLYQLKLPTLSWFSPRLWSYKTSEWIDLFQLYIDAACETIKTIKDIYIYCKSIEIYSSK